MAAVCAAHPAKQMPEVAHTDSRRMVESRPAVIGCRSAMFVEVASKSGLSSGAVRMTSRPAVASSATVCMIASVADRPVAASSVIVCMSAVSEVARRSVAALFETVCRIAVSEVASRYDGPDGVQALNTAMGAPAVRCTAVVEELPSEGATATATVLHMCVAGLEGPVVGQKTAAAAPLELVSVLVAGAAALYQQVHVVGQRP